MRSPCTCTCTSRMNNFVIFTNHTNTSYNSVDRLAWHSWKLNKLCSVVGAAGASAFAANRLQLRFLTTGGRESETEHNKIIDAGKTNETEPTLPPPKSFRCLLFSLYGASEDELTFVVLFSFFAVRIRDVPMNRLIGYVSAQDNFRVWTSVQIESVDFHLAHTIRASIQLNPFVRIHCNVWLTWVKVHQLQLNSSQFESEANGSTTRYNHLLHRLPYGDCEIYFMQWEWAQHLEDRKGREPITSASEMLPQRLSLSLSFSCPAVRLSSPFSE